MSVECFDWSLIGLLRADFPPCPGDNFHTLRFGKGQLDTRSKGSLLGYFDALKYPPCIYGFEVPYLVFALLECWLFLCPIAKYFNMLFQLSSYVNALAFIFVLLSSFIGTDGAVPSPKASTELICPTVHASDCYPTTFQPTEEFQIVKDDQALPPGLHIRMNLATGIKEARLNVPEPEDVHSDLVIVEKPDDEDRHPQPIDDVRGDVVESHEIPIHHDQTVIGEPARIRRPPFEPGEARTFEDSMSQLRNTSATVNDLNGALIRLQDLCHSGDWGLKLTKDSNVTQFLVHIFLDVSQQLSFRSGAALLLATAIQNNPEALAAALAHFYNDGWPIDTWPNQPLEAVLLALLHEHSPKFLIRTVFLLSSLCQDQIQLSKFVFEGGLDHLLQVFRAEKGLEPDGDKLRGKIANFILDHVIQADFPESSNDRIEYETVHSDETEGRTSEQESWIVVDESFKNPGIPNLEKLERNLKGWQLAFDESRKDLDSKTTHESVVARESVETAREALRKRLASKAKL